MVGTLITEKIPLFVLSALSSVVTLLAQLYMQVRSSSCPSHGD